MYVSHLQVCTSLYLTCMYRDGTDPAEERCPAAIPTRGHQSGNPWKGRRGSARKGDSERVRTGRAICTHTVQTRMVDNGHILTSN